MQHENTAKPQRVLQGGYTQAEVRSSLWFVMVAWVFGSAFFSITTGGAFTAFLNKYLQVDDFSYGLIMAAGPAAILFQFLGSYMVERRGSIKRPFLIFASLHRLFWLGIAAVPLIMPDSPRAVQGGFVALVVFLSTAAGNYGGAGWAAWMSRIVPRTVAGKYFGLRARLGLISMCVVGLGASALVDAFAGAGWIYTAIFVAAALMGATDILMFIPVREAPTAGNTQRPTIIEIITIPWKHPLFRGYAIYTALSWIGYMMMGPFVWPFAFDLGLKVLPATLLLTALPQLGMAVTAPFWGKAIDRFGPKPVLAASAISQIVLPLGWVIMRPEWIWCIPVITLVGGLTWPGIDQVFFYMQLKGFPDTRRTAYVAMILAVFGLACMLGTSLGGACAAFWEQHLHAIPHIPGWVSHYQPLFITAILVRLLAFVVFFPRLQIAGTARPGAVGRAIAGDVAASIPHKGKVRRGVVRGKS